MPRDFLTCTGISWSGVKIQRLAQCHQCGIILAVCCVAGRSPVVRRTSVPPSVTSALRRPGSTATVSVRRELTTYPLNHRRRVENWKSPVCHFGRAVARQAERTNRTIPGSHSTAPVEPRRMPVNHCVPPKSEFSSGLANAEFEVWMNCAVGCEFLCRL